MDQQAPDLDHLFAKNLIALREKKDLSKTDLARMMQEAGWESYSQMTVSRTESESRKVGVAEAHALAEVLGVEYGRFLQTDEEQQLQYRLDRVRTRISRMKGQVGRVILFQEEAARLIDFMDGEVPAHMRAEVERVLSWSVLQYVREEVAQHLADEDAELGLLNHLEEGDTSFVFGPVESELRERRAAEFEMIKEMGDGGFDQEA